jgi:hypothetical protein
MVIGRQTRAGRRAHHPGAAWPLDPAPRYRLTNCEPAIQPRLAICVWCQLALGKLDPEFAPKDVSGAMERVQRDVTLLRIKQAIELSTTGLHQRGHLVF